MAYKDIIYEPRYMDSVARITLNRPEKLNALGARLLDELFAALAEAEDDDEVKVVVIRGAGRAFCAGYDLNPAQVEALEGKPPEYDGRGLSWSFFKRSQRKRGIGEDLRFLYFRSTRWLTLWDYRKILVAQVHAYCLSGANELAGNCDIIIASDDTVFGHPAGRAQGLLPNSSGALWAINMGWRQAKWLALTGKTITADEALRIGYINKSVPKEDLEATVKDAAQSIATMEMTALLLHKKAINRFFEVAGLKSCVSTGAELDALFHASDVRDKVRDEFDRIKKEKGLKEALNWRDGRFGDGRTTKHPATQEEKEKA